MLEKECISYNLIKDKLTPIITYTLFGDMKATCDHKLYLTIAITF